MKLKQKHKIYIKMMRNLDNLNFLIKKKKNYITEIRMIRLTVIKYFFFLFSNQYILHKKNEQL